LRYHQDLILFYSEGDSEMQELADEVIEWGSELIENDTFPRSDYLELLQLTVLFLGSSVFPFSIRKPGSIKRKQHNRICKIIK
jgi:hypothetical protein